MKSSGLERLYTHSNLKFAEMGHIDLIGLAHPGALLRKEYTGFSFFRIFLSGTSIVPSLITGNFVFWNFQNGRGIY